MVSDTELQQLRHRVCAAKNALRRAIDVKVHAISSGDTDWIRESGATVTHLKELLEEVATDLAVVEALIKEKRTA